MLPEDLQCCRDFQKGMKTYMRRLEVSKCNLARTLLGHPKHNVIESDDYRHASDHIHRDIRSKYFDSRPLQQTRCGTTLASEFNLQHIIIHGLSELDVLIVCRYWARHANLRSLRTRIFSNAYELAGNIKDSRTHKIAQALTRYNEAEYNAEATMIPDIASLTLNCRDDNIHDASMLEVDVAGCRFVRADVDMSAKEKHDRAKVKYELLAPA